MEDSSADNRALLEDSSTGSRALLQGSSANGRALLQDSFALSRALLRHLLLRRNRRVSVIEGLLRHRLHLRYRYIDRCVIDVYTSVDVS